MTSSDGIGARDLKKGKHVSSSSACRSTARREVPTVSVTDGQFEEDPERLLILTELAEVPRSAIQLARLTGLAPERVRRHIRLLQEEGRVESVMTERKRGTVEHFHFLVGGLLRDEDDLAKLSLEERRRLYGQLLKIILTEATRALVTHPKDRNLERLDGAVVRTPIFTDEAGWEELAKLHRDFYERVLETRRRIAQRLAEKKEEGFKVSSALLLFESETAT
jgi:DNA-binding transcriptional ArsR family regulator